MDRERLRTHGPLIVAFLLIQFLGIMVLAQYAPQPQAIQQDNQTIIVKEYNLPFGFNPPSKIDYEFNLLQLVLSIVFVVFIILLLMKLQVVRVLRVWFFLVSAIAIAVTLFAFLSIPYSATIALIVGTAISYMKIFRPNLIIHNLAELLVYPGIAAVLTPMFNITTIVILFVIISLYDMYAVWHSGFMQRMATYQIKQVRVFSGLLLPQFLTKKGIVNPISFTRNKSKASKSRQKLGVAMLGGGDIIFPMLLSGVFLHSGMFALSVATIVGAALGLSLLILNSKKGTFYPAMPFITIGCFAAIILASLF